MQAKFLQRLDIVVHIALHHVIRCAATDAGEIMAESSAGR
jgi:hypothetical protein